MAKIYIAVGHGISQDGTFDSGCVYDQYSEAGLMLPIVREAVAILRKSGITVYTDADHANNKNMVATVGTANDLGVDAYVSVHCDYSLAPSGTYPIIYPGSKSGLKLATCLNTAFCSVTGEGTRGILERDDFEVARTSMTACIFETGSIKADINTLKDSKLCGKALAKGVCSYFGVKMKTVKSYEPKKVKLTGKWGRDTSKLMQYVFKVKPISGKIPNQKKADKKYLKAISAHSWKFKAGKGSATIKALQRVVGAKQDGYCGRETIEKLQSFLKKKNLYKGDITGLLDKSTVKAVQKYLNSKLK